MPLGEEMASVYLSATKNGKLLSLGPMTFRRAETLDPPLNSLDGYFLVESDGVNCKLLARVDDDDAALELGRLLGLD